MTYKEKSGIVIAQLRADRDRLQDALDKIREIVDDWQSDTWTDNISYECMVKIAELVEPQESEDNNADTN